MGPNLLKAILGGFVGTLAITLLMYVVAPWMLGRPMDVAGMLSNSLGVSRNAGMFLHFVNGTIIFPLIFAGLLWKYLPGRPAAKGVLFGLILWFLSQSIVMPLGGAGFFSSNAGGFLAVLASLVGHAIYGAILGGITGERAKPAAEIQRAA